MWIPTPNGTASVARLHVPRHEKGHVPSISRCEMVSDYLSDIVVAIAWTFNAATIRLYEMLPASTQQATHLVNRLPLPTWCARLSNEISTFMHVSVILVCYTIFYFQLQFDVEPISFSFNVWNWIMVDRVCPDASIFFKGRVEELVKKHEYGRRLCYSNTQMK